MTVGTGSSDINRGAYGFRLVLDAADPDLVAVSEAAPAVRLTWSQGVALRDAKRTDQDRYLVSYRYGGLIDVRRDPANATCVSPQPLPAAAVLHPVGTLPLSVLAHWRGDVTLHGGAFVAAGRAWVVVGERAAGKSSLLALAAARGTPIAADDLVTIGAEGLHAGPSCVDLRPDAAKRFTLARDLGVVGDRQRYRLSAPASSPVLPVGGIVVLGWSQAAADLQPLPTAERLEVLHRHHYAAHLGPQPPVRMLELAGLPMWRFSRSRDWDAAEDVLEGLLDAVTAA